MPASDPTNGVPTPTGTLQGVAAFSWDGAAWQPAGRAGPSVATPTGVLQGVAAFNGGPSWQPSGRAGPGVATPSGVLDGVAVYTWSGSAWTPPGGQPAPSTPSGALRGVAAFDWDGTAWQPAGQAGPDVATPYGVLQGVARFNWTGTAWAAVGAPSLSLDFMTPGTLDARITFTRASAATYFDINGTMQTAAVNAPRWDYDPATHALRGMLIEEARTNIWLQSADASNAAWAKAGGVVAAPTVTGNQTAAPDGTTTAARIVYPAVSGAGAYSTVNQNLITTANPSMFSVWLRGNVGGEQLYLNCTPDAVTWYRQAVTLTTAWQRFVLTMPAAPGGYYFQIGTDLRDAGQTSKPAQTIYAWGGQVELGAFPTSYIPTTAAAVTRAADACSMPVGAWYSAIASTLEIEAIFPTSNGSNQTTGDIDDGTTSNFARLFRSIGNTPLIAQVVSTAGGNFYNPTLGIVLAGSINKGAVAWQAGNQSSAMSGALGSPGAGTLIPAGMTTLRIGAIAGPAQILCGWVQRVRYWPRVLSNAELQSVTT